MHRLSPTPLLIVASAALGILLPSLKLKPSHLPLANVVDSVAAALETWFFIMRSDSMLWVLPSIVGTALRSLAEMWLPGDVRTFDPWIIKRIDHLDSRTRVALALLSLGETMRAAGLSVQLSGSRYRQQLRSWQDTRSMSLWRRITRVERHGMLYRTMALTLAAITGTFTYLSGRRRIKQNSGDASAAQITPHLAGLVSLTLGDVWRIRTKPQPARIPRVFAAGMSIFMAVMALPRLRVAMMSEETFRRRRERYRPFSEGPS